MFIFCDNKTGLRNSRTYSCNKKCEIEKILQNHEERKKQEKLDCLWREPCFPHNDINCATIIHCLSFEHLGHIADTR